MGINQNKKTFFNWAAQKLTKLFGGKSRNNFQIFEEQVIGHEISVQEYRDRFSPYGTLLSRCDDGAVIAGIKEGGRQALITAYREATGEGDLSRYVIGPGPVGVAKGVEMVEQLRRQELA